jgi:hypothetical protein
MNDKSIYNPEPWRRVDRNLRELYEDLVAHYNVDRKNDVGEIVEQFSDKGTVHSYIEFYAEQFAPVRKYARMLEIGLMTGASMKLWSEYFYLYKLAGIDLRQGWNQTYPWQQDIESDANIELHFGIDSTTQQVEFDEPFHIILDDGAHDWQSQFLTFRNYWPQLAQGGVYYIEDVENDDSSAKLQQAIARWIGPGHQIGMNEYRGLKQGRADDRVLMVKKL